MRFCLVTRLANLGILRAIAGTATGTAIAPMTETAAEKTGGTQNVRAVTRALTVLNSFAGKNLQSLAQVSAATGLDKGTTRRLLLTLMGSDFIAQDPVTQHYRLGPAIRKLAANVENSRDLRALAQPILLQLAGDLGVTMFLSVFQDDAAVCLDRVHDMRGIEVHWWAVGGTLPLNAGGAPKLFLAYQSAETIDRLLAEPLPSLNARTITDPATLRLHLEQIRKRGWECAVDDVALGITALAVPVLDGEERIICCLSMAGLTPQMVERGRPVHLRRLQDAAAALRDKLET
jgi:DNA-binding IclR family transcriptional regulator